MTAIVPDWKLWDPWRPEQIADFLADLAVPWYVAAGWAIDLFHGEERREHEDLEIAVPNDRFEEAAAVLKDFEVYVITAPQEALPLEDAWNKLEDTHQTWVCEPGSSSWRFDLFREPSDRDMWLCRREPSITMPYAHLIERTADGIPYGRPEVILLFKAKHAHMEKNRSDFADTLLLLDDARRAWLRDALERVHPGHEWLGELEP
jgi:Aminoglycoside-2''-adenylyltransferase